MEDDSVLIIDEEVTGTPVTMEKRPPSCGETTSENASDQSPAKRSKPSPDGLKNPPPPSLFGSRVTEQMKNILQVGRGYGSSPIDDGSKPKEPNNSASTFVPIAPRPALPQEPVKIVIMPHQMYPDNTGKMIDKINQLEQTVNQLKTRSQPPFSRGPQVKPPCTESNCSVHRLPMVKFPPLSRVEHSFTVIPPKINNDNSLANMPQPTQNFMNNAPIMDGETNVEMNDEYIFTRIFNTGTKTVVVQPASSLIVKLPKRKMQEILSQY